MAKKTAVSLASAAPARAVDKIRATARELFYRQGIRAVGVDEIVQRAGVTKPSLYRSFASKDELAASYMRDYEADFWTRFDASAAAHPDDPRRQMIAYFEMLSGRTRDGYRGCGLTNAVVEYPDSDHPARKVATGHKAALRKRLRDLAKAMGAERPAELGDALVLLIEGALVSGQIFGKGGPSAVLAQTAQTLIDAHVKPARRSGK
ncbi:MAG TPA: TetR/AcrR family transcriptional regulator [Alphaproteobacteria bacterium]